MLRCLYLGGLYEQPEVTLFSCCCRSCSWRSGPCRRTQSSLAGFVCRAQSRRPRASNLKRGKSWQKLRGNRAFHGSDLGKRVPTPRQGECASNHRRRPCGLLWALKNTTVAEQALPRAYFVGCERPDWSWAIRLRAFWRRLRAGGSYNMVSLIPPMNSPTRSFQEFSRSLDASNPTTAR